MWSGLCHGVSALGKLNRDQQDLFFTNQGTRDLIHKLGFSMKYVSCPLIYKKTLLINPIYLIMPLNLKYFEHSHLNGILRKEFWAKRNQPTIKKNSFQIILLVGKHPEFRILRTLEIHSS